MRRSKKLIITAVLTAVILAGSIGGVVLADNGDNSQSGALFEALWDKVSAIYKEKTGDTLDQEALKEAFAGAQSELRLEAMQNRIQSMVEEGKITQEQADEYLNWQKAMPEIADGFGFRGHIGFHGMGGLRGMGGMHGFGTLCAPTE